jgi:hypothetical protein
MAAEDFAYMLNSCPGANINIGNGDTVGGCPVHNSRYDFNDEASPIGAQPVCAPGGEEVVAAFRQLRVDAPAREVARTHHVIPDHVLHLSPTVHTLGNGHSSRQYLRRIVDRRTGNGG